MAKNEYFAHTSPTGITPWYWLSQVDYNFIYAGENLAVDLINRTTTDYLEYRDGAYYYKERHK